MAAPRKSTAARKLASATPDKPTMVSLDLDALEREGTVEPFVIKLGGERYVMVDAMDLDWRDLSLAQTDPISFFDIVIAEDQRDKFKQQRMTVFQVDKMMRAYMDHHGMPLPGDLGALPT